MCRGQRPIVEGARDKLSMFCQVRIIPGLFSGFLGLFAGAFRPFIGNVVLPSVSINA